MTPTNSTTTNNKKKKIAAIFDLDKTLHKGTTGWSFLRLLRKNNTVTWKELTAVVIASLLHKTKLLDLETFLDKSISGFTGHSVTTYKHIARQAFEKSYHKRLFVDALDRIKQHRNQGHMIIIATASIREAITPIADFFNADRLIAFELEKKQDRFTGKAKKPYCWSGGKRYYVKAMAKKENIDLKKSYFYSDSHVDIPLLKEVGHPIVVNPDARLRLTAKEHEWTVITFRKTLKRNHGKK